MLYRRSLSHCEFSNFAPFPHFNLGYEEEPTGQNWRSMTERFRYPPKGYAKENDPGTLENPHNIVSSEVRSPNTALKKTLTSSVSQKIHMDRIQNEKGEDRITRTLAAESRPKSGRISGIEYQLDNLSFRNVVIIILL